MIKDDYEFGERITRDLQARRAARKILGVEDASQLRIRTFGGRQALSEAVGGNQAMARRPGR